MSALGEDRFYHAMYRAELGPYAKLFYEAFGGEHWEHFRSEMRLPSGRDLRKYPSDEDFYEVLCEVSFIVSSHYKQYALKSPVLPPSIHARMVLDKQNEWTKVYAKGLAKHGET